jgi:DNA-binding MarR family transcriptional regulator
MDLERGLGFLLNDVSRLMRQRFDERARRLGLTRAQWRVLGHLRRYEGINQGALAELLEVETVTLGRHIDRLEDAGWVERRRDPSDRRVWRLHLAEKSRPMIDRLTDLSLYVQRVFFFPASSLRIECSPAPSRRVVASSHASAAYGLQLPWPPRRASGEIMPPSSRLFKDPLGLPLLSTPLLHLQSSSWQPEPKPEASGPELWPELLRPPPSSSSSF